MSYFRLRNMICGELGCSWGCSSRGYLAVLHLNSPPLQEGLDIESYSSWCIFILSCTSSSRTTFLQHNIFEQEISRYAFVNLCAFSKLTKHNNILSTFIIFNTSRHIWCEWRCLRWIILCKSSSLATSFTTSIYQLIISLCIWNSIIISQIKVKNSQISTWRTASRTA